MDTKTRREHILKDIKQADKALSATTLAKKYGVSRQVIVGDIAILKAQKEAIVASVRGYLYITDEKANTYTIACDHNSKDTIKELQIMVDQGAIVQDVIVDHPVYGELVGKLDIHSRYDIEQFIKRLEDTKARNLSEMNDGVHLHTIVCESEEIYQRIILKLRESGYLYE